MKEKSNIEQIFEDIEKNPDSKQAKELKEAVYNNFKQESINLDKSMKEGIDLKTLQKLNDAMQTDTKQNLLTFEMKKTIDKINNQAIKDIAIKEGSNYELCYYLELLVNFTNNERLKAFVKQLKELHLHD